MTCIVSILIGDLPYKSAAKANHEDYCARHGYAYYCLSNSTSAVGQQHHPMWQKPELILQKLNEGFELVFWMDGDSFFMDMDRKLESFMEADGYSLGTWLRAFSDLHVSGDHNDLVNTGHMLFRNSAWSKGFVEEWLRFRRPLQPQTLAQFAPITTHFIVQREKVYFNDQPPVAILLAGGNAANEAGWFDAFNRVNLYEGNAHRLHSSSDYAPIKPENLERAHSLLAPKIGPHVNLLLQSEMNSYAETYKQGDFILHLVGHKHDFNEILEALRSMA